MIAQQAESRPGTNDMSGKPKAKTRRPPGGRGMFDRILGMVRRIPYGHVATYGQVAGAAGFPGAARQVVWALHAARGLPWHRVVGARGRILLSGEAGLEQQIRLHTEGVTFIGGRVAMEQHQVRWRKAPPRGRKSGQRVRAGKSRQK